MVLEGIARGRKLTPLALRYFFEERFGGRPSFESIFWREQILKTVSRTFIPRIVIRYTPFFVNPV